MLDINKYLNFFTCHQSLFHTNSLSFDWLSIFVQFNRILLAARFDDAQGSRLFTLCSSISFLRIRVLKMWALMRAYWRFYPSFSVLLLALIRIRCRGIILLQICWLAKLIVTKRIIESFKLLSGGHNSARWKTKIEVFGICGRIKMTDGRRRFWNAGWDRIGAPR